MGSSKDKGSPSQPPTQPKKGASFEHHETGVFYDDECFHVLYEGKLIATVGNAQEGWNLLRNYERKRR